MLHQWKDCQSLTAPQKYHVQILCSLLIANLSLKTFFIVLPFQIQHPASFLRMQRDIFFEILFWKTEQTG